MRYYKIPLTLEIVEFLTMCNIMNAAIRKVKEVMNYDRIINPYGSFAGGIEAGIKNGIRHKEPWMDEFRHIKISDAVGMLGGKWDGKSELFIVWGDQYILAKYPGRLRGELLTKEAFENDKQNLVTRATLLGGKLSLN